MSLFVAMLPFYLLGNLHCIGMCGPLVAMIGRHRYRFYYFLGRILSFSAAGGLAGGAGHVLGVALSSYHLSALVSFFFGTIIALISCEALTGWSLPGQRRFAQAMATGNQAITPLILQDRALPTLLFGFFTVALPCGQTLIVFSACALAGDASIGVLNGALFAVLTSPSLMIAMHAYHLFPKLRGYANPLMGGAGLLIAALAMGRGLAEMDVIPHLVLNSTYHIVIF